MPRAHPATSYKNRMKYDVVTRDDGTVELLDKSAVPFQPTPEQITWLEKWLWDWDYNLDETKAIHSVGGTYNDIKRWMRDPAFLDMVNNEVNKRFGSLMPQAKMTLARVAEDPAFTLKPKEKWAIDRIVKIDDAMRQRELKVIQLFQMNNNFYGVSPDMPDDQLQGIIDADIDAEVIEGETSEDSG